MTNFVHLPTRPVRCPVGGFEERLAQLGLVALKKMLGSPKTILCNLIQIGTRSVEVIFCIL